MKEFNDFLKTLDEETIMNLTKKFNDSSLNKTVSSDDIPNLIAEMSIYFSIELLHLYHDWLNS